MQYQSTSVKSDLLPLDKRPHLWAFLFLRMGHVWGATDHGPRVKQGVARAGRQGPRAYISPYGKKTAPTSKRPYSGVSQKKKKLKKKLQKNTTIDVGLCKSLNLLRFFPTAVHYTCVTVILFGVWCRAGNGETYEMRARVNFFLKFFFFEKHHYRRVWCKVYSLTCFATSLKVTVHTLEKEMPKRYDEPCRLNAEIHPRRHSVRRGNCTHYPFKAMIKGDYFVLESPDEAERAHNALRTFLRSNHCSRGYFIGAQFTIRPPKENPDSIWICRRVK